MAKESGEGESPESTYPNDTPSNNTSPPNTPKKSNFFSPRPNLNRGFEAYTPPPSPPQPQPPSTGYPGYPSPHHPEGTPQNGTSPNYRPTSYQAPGVSRTNVTSPTGLTPTVPAPPKKRKGLARFLPWKASSEPSAQVPVATPTQAQPGQPTNGFSGNSTFPPVQTGQPVPPNWPYPEEGYGPSEEYGFGTEPVEPAPLKPTPLKPTLWERQPYRAIALTLTIGSSLTFAWIFGILVAQVLPGKFSNPPLQETTLRRSSRLISRLWHFRQLWQSPTAETRITAVPLPESGPVLGPLELSPIERQPLIDELNAIETDTLTLDRRLEALEKRMGRPPYQGAAIDNRINALRTAIDPPVRSQATPDYEPTPTDGNQTLLDVAKVKITLPADALFTPGDSTLQDTALMPQLLDQLVNYPDSTIIIRSYSDNQINSSDSRDYTLAQANALAGYLARSLPTTHRWVTLGGGPANALTDNSDAIAQQQNRRLEILVDTR